MSNSDGTLLILFPQSYPYSASAENTFLHPEIMYLSRYFTRVVIVPAILDGEREIVPENIEIDTTYGKALALPTVQRLLLFLGSRLTANLFLKDILSKPHSLISYRYIRRSLLFIGKAVYTKRWVENYIITNKINVKKTLFYTYWLDSAALGIGLSKACFQGLQLVSRAHGLDIYYEQNNPPMIPCRKQTLELIDCIFTISQHGKDYLLEKHPTFNGNLMVSRLGVHDPGFLTRSSGDDVFRIVSCSSVVDVKRLDILIRGLAVLARQRDGLKFEWYHIGDGPLRSRVEELATELIPLNVQYSFMGQLDNRQVYKFYKDNPLDVFINVSSSEGIPVSIMEAQSCGIPVIATAVGGVPEIVSDKVGRLIDSAPDPEDIASAISFFVDNPRLIGNWKQESRVNWLENYSAGKNYASFAKSLHTLI